MFAHRKALPLIKLREQIELGLNFSSGVSVIDIFYLFFFFSRKSGLTFQRQFA